MTDKNKKIDLMQRAAEVAMLVFPISFIAIPKVTTTLATLLFLICSIHLFLVSFSIKTDRSIKIIILSFFSYPLAIAISQIIRGHFELVDFQQQGRILLLLPVFFYVYHFKLNISKFAGFIVPITCISGAASSLFLFNSGDQWGSRSTVMHIDPLNFGYLMLFLAFSSLWVGLRWSKNNWFKVMCFCAFLCGLYTSIKSGSRTGWLGIPIVAFWFLWSAGKLKIKSICVVSIIIIAASIAIYNFSEIAYHRTNEAIIDIKNYHWSSNPAANDSSVGIRISMIRMAWYCFLEAPLSGYGIRNIYDVLNNDAIKVFATDSTINFSSSGFMHNELLTQLIKHGVMGGLAYLFVLFSIFYIFYQLNLNCIKMLFPDIFIIYTIFAMTASLSTEILVVKPMILFFGFMLACYAGESLWRIHDKERAAKS